jgi:hypothetical protein
MFGEVAFRVNNGSGMLSRNDKAAIGFRFGLVPCANLPKPEAVETLEVPIINNEVHFILTVCAGKRLATEAQLSILSLIYILKSRRTLRK